MVFKDVKTNTQASPDKANAAKANPGLLGSAGKGRTTMSQDCPPEVYEMQLAEPGRNNEAARLCPDNSMRNLGPVLEQGGGSSTTF